MRIARDRAPDLRTISAASPVALLLALLAACAPSSDSPRLTSPSGETPVQEARAAASGKEPDAEPPRESSARTLDGYKRDAARRIYFRSIGKLYDGAPPPLLKSIVVLSIEIDAQGQIKLVKMIRSNGFKDLEQRAMQSVRDAAPLPVPRESLLKRGRVEYFETWLFRDDDRFQIRSLAEAQQGAD